MKESKRLQRKSNLILLLAAAVFIVSLIWLSLLTSLEQSPVYIHFILAGATIFVVYFAIWSDRVARQAQAQEEREWLQELREEEKQYA